VPYFLGEFSKELETKKAELIKIISLNDDKLALYGELIEAYWHDLEELSLPNVSVRAYGVDSSDGLIKCRGGAVICISRSIAVGNSELPMLTKLKVVPILLEEGEEELLAFRSKLREHLEHLVALKALEHLEEGDVLFLDGSLYSRLTHIPSTRMLREVRIAGYESLPLDYLESYLELLFKSEERKVILIGMSKDSRSTSLRKFLLNLSKGKLGSKQLAEEKIYPRSDLQILIWYLRRKGRVKGFTSPLLLGVHQVHEKLFYAYRRGKLRDYIGKRFKRAIAREGKGVLEKAEKVISSLLRAPSIISMYLVPREGQEPFRIDVPCWALGKHLRLGEVRGPKEVRVSGSELSRLISTILSFYPGPNLRHGNSLLEVADRKVKLREKVLKEVYEKFMENKLGLKIEHPRGDLSYR